MKIVYIVPHLPTGGMPEYLRKKIELLHTEHEIWVFEIYFESKYPAVRDKIKHLIGDRLVTFQRNYKKLLIKLKQISPDLIHFEETPEYFLNDYLLENIYNKDRDWKIIETLHDSSIDYREKKFISDKMLVVSQWQVKNFLLLGIPIEIIQHEIKPGARERISGLEKLKLSVTKKHVLQVGLFSNRKNQRYTFDLARKMSDVEFHFVGALPYAYKDHWQDLIDNKPPNCTVWGERSDVELFYSCMDVVIFPSEGTYGDTETNPLAIKEAIAWKIPLFLRNIPVYMNMYPESNLVKYITHNEEENKKILYNMLNLMDNYTLIKKEFFDQKLFNVNFDTTENKITISYLHNEALDLRVCIRDIDTEIPIFSFVTTFENKNDCWAIPLPIHYYNFTENPHFSGFLIDFYDPGNNLLHSIKHPIKEINVAKLKCRIDTKEPIFINYEQFFTDRIYDSFLDKIENLDLVLDVGSSIGLFTKLVKGKGAKRVVSFEVSKKATDVFKKLHSDDESIELVERAIWNKNDVIRIYEDPENSIVSSAVVRTDNFFEIESINLDSYFEKNNIENVSLMKMDIEGSEYASFEGLSDYNLGKIDNLIIEFHENFSGILSARILKRLDSLGFEYEIFQEDCKTKAMVFSDEKGVVFARKRQKGLSDPLTNTDEVFSNSIDKTIIIIDCQFTSSILEQKLTDQVKKFKSSGFDVLLVSNIQIKKEIQESVDYFLYDKRNQLFNDIYKNTQDISVEKNIYDGNELQFTLIKQLPNIVKYRLSNLANLNNSVVLAKSMGYENFIKIEADDIYNQNSIQEILSLSNDFSNSEKGASLFYKNLSEKGEELMFNLMFWNIDFFLDKIPNIQSELDYQKIIKEKFTNTDFVSFEDLFDNLLRGCESEIIKTSIEENLNFTQNTEWNTEVSFYDNYSGSKNYTTDVFKIEDIDEVFIFSQNQSNTEIVLEIEVQFLDKSFQIYEQKIPGYWGGWCWNRIPGVVDRVDFFENGRKIATKYLEDIKNFVVFQNKD